MTNLSMNMRVEVVLPGKSEKGNEYKKIKLVGLAGYIITCIFPDDKVFTAIKEGELRHVTLVSRIYNGKEKYFVNIKEVVHSDEATPFGDVESPWQNVDDGTDPANIKG